MTTNQSTVPLLYEYKISLSENQIYVASKLVLNLLKGVVHHHAEEVRAGVKPTNPKRIKKGTISDSGKAKIRYVGGMCIARTKKHYTNIIKNNLGNPDKNAIERLLNAKNNVMF